MNPTVKKKVKDAKKTGDSANTSSKSKTIKRTVNNSKRPVPAKKVNTSKKKDKLRSVPKNASPSTNKTKVSRKHKSNQNDKLEKSKKVDSSNLRSKRIVKAFSNLKSTKSTQSNSQSVKSKQYVQIGLGVDSGFESKLQDIKHRLLSRQEEVELQPFWKSLSSILAASSSFILSLLLIIGGLVNYGSLPPEVPLYYDHSIGTWQLVDKSNIFLLGMMYMAISIGMSKLVFEVYTFDRRLANITNWIMVFVNVASYFAIGQITSLIL